MSSITSRQYPGLHGEQSLTTSKTATTPNALGQAHTRVLAT